MIHYTYNEKQIIATMKFTGFTRQEAIDYLNVLTERNNQNRIRMEQESKAFDELIASFNSRPAYLAN